MKLLYDGLSIVIGLTLLNSQSQCFKPLFSLQDWALNSNVKVPDGSRAFKFFKPRRRHLLLWQLFDYD